MRHRGRLAFLVATVVVAFLSTGCASTARLSQFDAFATAGSTYSTAMNGLLTEAGQVLLDANSSRLLWTAKPQLENAAAEKKRLKAIAPAPADLADRLAAVDNQTAAMLVGRRSEEDPDYDDEDPCDPSRAGLCTMDELAQENLEAIENLRLQAGILAAYFRQLAALATSDVADQFSAQLQGTVTALNQASNDIEGSALFQDAGGAQQLLGGVGGMIVRGIQVKALETELERNKDTIAEVMKLHEVMLGLLTDLIQHEKGLVRRQAYETQVEAALLDGRAVKDPQGWIKLRRELNGPAPLTPTIKSTMGALQNMRGAWAKLLTNKLTLADVQSVVADLQPALAGAASLRSQ